MTKALVVDAVRAQVWRALILNRVEKVAILAALLFVSTISMVILSQKSYDIGQLFLDPVVAANLHLRDHGVTGVRIRLHHGILTNFGSIVWFSSVPLLLVAAYALKHAGDVRLALGAVGGAALTTVLVLDEMLMLHIRIEHVVPKGYIPLFGFYAIATAAYLSGFVLRLSSRASPVTFMAAAGCFALSIVVDQAVPVGSPTLAILMEDMPKLLGILLWTGYHMALGCGLLTATPPERRAQAGDGG